MRQQLPSMVVLVLAGTLLFGCAGPAAPTPSATQAPAPTAKPAQAVPTQSAPAATAAPAKPAASAPTSSAAALDALRAAAEKEGRVVIYDALPATSMDPVINAFQKKYPAIKVDYVSLGLAAQITSRVMQETQAKAKTADAASIVEDGVPELHKALGIRNVLHVVDWKSLGVLPELMVKYPSPEDQIGVKYNATLWSLQYNTDLVKSDPKWPDLLDPKWRGRLAFSRLATPWVAFSTVWGEEQTADYIQKLFGEQQAQVVASAAALANGLASGELAIGLGLRHSATPSIKKGAPIALGLSDMVAVSGTLMGVPVNAEHPNAGKLWIAWLVSAEGQPLYDQATDRGLAEVPGTWVHDNLHKLNVKVAEWPPGQKLDEKSRLAAKFIKLYPGS